MPANTRSKILDYLQRNASTTAEELSRTLQMTPANIRYHLALLEKEGQTVILGIKKEAKGRPTHLYGASDQVLGTGLRPLVEAILITWDENGEAQQENRLKRLAEHLAKIDPSEPNMNVSKKLNRMVNRLNELHYQARWEAGAAGARMILGHCPYAEIIEGHPELCRMDVFLLEARTGLLARQRTKLEPGRDGVRRCVFLIG